MDAEAGTILGLIDAQFLSRQSGRKAVRWDLAIEAKESFRWLQAADQAASVCAGAGRITVVADRESDIFEAFALRPDAVDLLVRAAQDRGLEDGGRLFAAIDAMAEASLAEIALPVGPGRRRRVAQAAVRFASLSLARPQHG